MSSTKGSTGSARSAKAAASDGHSRSGKTSKSSRPNAPNLTQSKVSTASSKSSKASEKTVPVGKGASSDTKRKPSEATSSKTSSRRSVATTESGHALSPKSSCKARYTPNANYLYRKLLRSNQARRIVFAEDSYRVAIVIDPELVSEC
ncbi:hypothetical protein MTO96_026976 [Rhipicephalus appendiculatus]